jgi:hypothetical protein
MRHPSANAPQSAGGARWKVATSARREEGVANSSLPNRIEPAGTCICWAIAPNEARVLNSTNGLERNAQQRSFS